MFLRILLFVSGLFFSVSLFSQNIEFEETTHDFGTIYEKDGKVIYQFKFTVKGTVSVKILNVQASCGCTTPSWTQEEVQPNQTGLITSQYDPTNRPGPFTKTLTVLYSGNSKTLTIKGIVEREKPEPIVKTYQEFFGYNANEINSKQQQYAEFISSIANYLKMKPEITLQIESSASHVPTKRFTENQRLADSRAKQFEKKIIKSLKDCKVDVTKVHFLQAKSLVQGPVYKDDFEENKKEYLKYQYVKVETTENIK